MGDDQWGGKYKEHLHTMGVDVTHAHVTKDTSTGIAQISVADNGDNQIVIVPGANNHLSKADVDNAKELLKKADVLIGQLETPYETTLEAFKLNDGVRLLQNTNTYFLQNIVSITLLWPTTGTRHSNYVGQVQSWQATNL